MLFLSSVVAPALICGAFVQLVKGRTGLLWGGAVALLQMFFLAMFTWAMYAQGSELRHDPEMRDSVLMLLVGLGGGVFWLALLATLPKRKQ